MLQHGKIGEPQQKRIDLRSFLINENLGLLKQGREVIASLSDGEFCRPLEGTRAAGTVGKHFRHVLNFYDNLCDHADGVLDYDVRIRDPEVENRPASAIRLLVRIEEQLKLWKEGGTMPEEPLYIAIGDGERSFHRLESSLERELKFVLEHALHHYAIIAMVLHSRDISLPHGFGIAPSTLKYLERK